MKRLDLNHLKKKFHEIKIVRVAVLAISLLSTNSIFLSANPHSPTVKSGAATFSNPSNSTLQINATNNTIINWDSFSIEPGEITSFLQPSSSSAVLNRVTGKDLSNILGTLQSNGSVYLVNPNGILVGQGAVINTGSFLASTLDIADSDFLAGKDLPFTGSTKNGIVNLGTIQSTAGDVVLLGYTVDNQGSLSAPQGGVRIGSGTDIILQVNGPERIVIKTKPLTEPKDGTGINNSGTVHSVVAELKADGNPYLFGIHHDGQINATGIVTQNGQVYLRADNGRTAVAGTTTAINQDGTGGNITILGDQIAVLENSTIDTSGDNGGGTILIGGGYQGKDPSLPNARQVVIQQNTQINSNANLNGNGGMVVQWSDDLMFHSGHNSATGGSVSGNGGLVEASGKNYLDYNGTIDLTAANGNTGTLLLDPTSLTISSAVSSAISGASPFYPNVPGTTGNLNLTTLSTALGSGNVIVYTSTNSDSQSGDITWTGLLSISTTNSLTVTSVGSIYINGITTGSGLQYSGGGNLSLNAARDIVFSGGSSGASPFAELITDGLCNITAGRDFQLLGGTGSNSFADIVPFTGEVVINVGENLILQAGSGSTAFAQIGNRLESSQANISISAKGSDILLDASNGGTNSWAAIGHGNLFGAGESPYVGNIILTGSAATSLSLLGGSSNTNFAQIGHYVGTHQADINGVIGDITISNFGGNINLTPNNASAAIGQGSRFSTVPTLSGNINLYNNTGSINLNPGTTNQSYSQVGHVNANNTTGNVTVMTTGNLNMTAGPFDSTDAVIGHGNSFSPNSAFYKGQIFVSADTVQITGSGGFFTGANSNAVIGFETNHASMFSSMIDPSSQISVTAINDINIFGGSTSAQIGNTGSAIIGYFTLGTQSGNATIDSIDVQSLQGNITLMGGLNVNSGLSLALIGTDVSSATSQTFLPQSNINVSAPLGNVNLYATPLTITDTGSDFSSAIITTGHSSNPFDLTLTAKNLILDGAYLQLNNPLAFGTLISASQNMNLNIADNLEMTAGNSNCVISHNLGTMTIDIGADLIMNAGTRTNSNNFVQIGNPFANQFSSNPIVFKNIGSNLTLNAGGGTGFQPRNYAIIGHGDHYNSVSGAINADIVFENIGANVNLTGGNQSDAFAQIGHVGSLSSSQSINGDIKFLSVGGAINLMGGSQPYCSAIIGQDCPLIIGANGVNINGQITINSSESVSLTAGSNILADAIIGFGGGTSSSGYTINSHLVEVTSNGPITLTAGTGSNAAIGFCNIQASETLIDVQNINVAAKGGNIALNGGSLGIQSPVGGTACIGLISQNESTSSSIKMTTPYDILLTVGLDPSGAPLNGQAIITNGTTPGGTVKLDPTRIILLAGSGNSDIQSSGNLDINFTDLLSINYDPADPLTLQNGQASITAVNDILINTYAPSYGDIFILGPTEASLTSSFMSTEDGVIQIGTLDQVGAGSFFIGKSYQTGPARILPASNFIASVSEDFVVEGNPNTSNGFSQLNVTEIGNITINAGGNISQIGSSSFNTSNIYTVTGYAKLTALGQIISNSGQATGAGLTLTAGTDLIMSGTSTYLDILGNLQGNIGRDLLMNNNSEIRQDNNGSILFNIKRDAIISDNSLINATGTGNIELTIGRDLIGSGTNNGLVSGGGNLIIDAGRNIDQSGSFSMTAYGKKLFMTAGQDLNLSNASQISMASNGILKLLADNISLKNTSLVNVAGSGDLYMIANYKMNLLDTSRVITQGGNLTLVVDNAFPDIPFYGTGSIVKSAGAFVNAGGGAARIFTSRQPFNSISGDINGTVFVPGIEYLNTPQERWGTYFETAFNGVPFTIFYKDTGTPIIPPPHPNPHHVHDFGVALAEALQEWKVLDQLHLAPVEFCSTEFWLCEDLDSECDGVYTAQYFSRRITSLRKELVTYNTMKLLEILE